MADPRGARRRRRRSPVHRSGGRHRDPALAERLLREGLERPRRPAAARRARPPARSGGPARRGHRAGGGLRREAPDDVAARVPCARPSGTGRWPDALAAATRRRASGRRPPSDRAALALAAEDWEALAALAAAAPAATARAASPSPDRVRRRAGDRRRALVLGRTAPAPVAAGFWRRGRRLRAPHRAARGPARLGARARQRDARAGRPGPGGRTRRRGVRPPAAGRGHGRVQRRQVVLRERARGAEVAPTGVTPTTATINVLRYGATPEARVVHHDGRRARSPPPTSPPFSPRCATPTRATSAWSRSSCPSRRSGASRSSTRPASTRSAPSTSGWRATSCATPTPSSGCSPPARPPRPPRARRWPSRTRPASGCSACSTRSTAQSPARSKRVVRHVGATLGDLVEPVVPFSATRALAAREPAGRTRP